MARFDGLNHILSKAKVRYVQQDEPKGLGHAVFCAKDYVKMTILRLFYLMT